MRWVIGILVVVVLVIIGYQYFGNRGVEVAEQPAPAVTEQPAEQPPAEVAEPAEPATPAPGESAEAPAQTREQPAEATQETAEQAQGTAEQAQGTAEQAQGTAEQAQGTAEQAQETAEQAAAGAQQATEQAAEATQEAAQATGEAAQEPAAGAGQAAQETLTEAQVAALTVGNVNLGEQVRDAVQNVEAALQGITDAQSAEAAVPQLNAVNTRLEELGSTVDQLPDDAKKVLADVLNKRVEELKTMAAEVTAREGVGDVVKPALDPIIAKLEDWSRQPA